MQSPFEQPPKSIGARSLHSVCQSDESDASSKAAVRVSEEYLPADASDADEGFGTIVTHVEGQAIVHVSGELDMATAPKLSECLQSLVASGVPAVVVDLSRLAFLDSSGLGALLAFAHRADELGTRLVLRAPTPAVRRVFELTATDRLFEIDA